MARNFLQLKLQNVPKILPQIAIIELKGTVEPWQRYALYWVPFLSFYYMIFVLRGGHAHTHLEKKKKKIKWNIS